MEELSYQQYRMMMTITIISSSGGNSDGIKSYVYI